MANVECKLLPLIRARRGLWEDMPKGWLKNRHDL